MSQCFSDLKYLRYWNFYVDVIGYTFIYLVLLRVPPVSVFMRMYMFCTACLQYDHYSMYICSSFSPFRNAASYPNVMMLNRIWRVKMIQAKMLIMFICFGLGKKATRRESITPSISHRVSGRWAPSTPYLIPYTLLAAWKQPISQLVIVALAWNVHYTRIGLHVRCDDARIGRFSRSIRASYPSVIAIITLCCISLSQLTITTIS